eukprot:949296-Amphidinium_carterae.2
MDNNNQPTITTYSNSQPAQPAAAGTTLTESHFVWNVLQVRPPEFFKPGGKTRVEDHLLSSCMHTKAANSLNVGCGPLAVGRSRSSESVGAAVSLAVRCGLSACLTFCTNDVWKMDDRSVVVKCTESPMSSH